MIILNVILYIWWILAIIWGLWNISSNPPFACILILVWIFSLPIVYSNIKRYVSVKNFSYIYTLWLIWIFILNYILFPAQNTNISQTPTVEIIDKQTEKIQKETNIEAVEPTYETYSEEKKKMLYIELVKAQDKAWKEAEAKFPTNWSDVCPNLNNCMWKEELLQRTTGNNNESKRLKEIYETDFREKNWLSIENQKSLLQEGNEKLWPLPNY